MTTNVIKCNVTSLSTVLRAYEHIKQRMLTNEEKAGMFVKEEVFHRGASIPVLSVM